MTALQRAVGNRAFGDLLPRRRVASRGNELPPGVRSVLNSAGQELDPATRGLMELRFGRDFGDVRVHTDAEAAWSAGELDARAYTVGRHVVFPDAAYADDRREGSEGLAHELAHVVQQTRGGRAPEVSPGAAHELGADAAAKAAVGGEARVTVGGATGVGVARQALDLAPTGAPLDLSDWDGRTPNLIDPTVWSDSRLIDKLDQVERWLAADSSSSPKSAVAATARQDLRGEIERRAARAVALAATSDQTSEDVDPPTPQGPKAAPRHRPSSPRRGPKSGQRQRPPPPPPRPSSLSLLSADDMCGGRCYTDEEIYKDYNDARARIAEEDRQATLQGKASVINKAMEEDEGDRIVELFDPSLINADDFNFKTNHRRRSSSSSDPRDRIELQHKLDMEKVIGSLSDFNAVRLGTLGPVTAGQDKLNEKRAAYIKQVIDDFAPLAPDRAAVFALYALSAAHDDDAHAIFAELANNRRLSRLLKLPHVADWIKARGLDASVYAEPSESWTAFFPRMGRGMKHFVKDDRPGKYQSQKSRLPDEYIDLLSTMETDEFKRSLTVKNMVIGAIDEITFGAPHGAIDFFRSLGRGAIDVAQGEYGDAGEELSGAAIVVLTHVAAKAWRSVRPSVNVGAGATLALEADAQGTLARVRERFGTGGIDRAATMIQADSRAALFVVENGEAGLMALLEAEGDVQAATGRLSASRAAADVPPATSTPAGEVTAPSGVPMALDEPKGPRAATAPHRAPASSGTTEAKTAVPKESTSSGEPGRPAGRRAQKASSAMAIKKVGSLPAKTGPSPSTSGQSTEAPTAQRAPKASLDELSLDQLRALARTDGAAALSLWQRYGRMSRPELNKLARQGDATAKAVLRQQLPPNPKKVERIMARNPPGRNAAVNMQLKEDLAAYRKSLGVPRADLAEVEGGTAGVGRSNVPGLENRVFKGGSPRTGESANPRYQPPSTHGSAHGHAEQNLAGEVDGALRQVVQSGVPREQLQGKSVWMRIEQEVCSSCRAGLAEESAGAGVLKQLSRDWPEITFEVSAAGTSEILIIRGGVVQN